MNGEMIILHFHLQPQFKNELFHIYFTSFIRLVISSSSLELIGQKTELSLLNVFADPLQLHFHKYLLFFFWRFAFGVTTFGDRWPRAGIEPLGLALEGVRGAISFTWSSAQPHANASRNSVNILKQFSIFLRHFLRTDLLPSSLS